MKNIIRTLVAGGIVSIGLLATAGTALAHNGGVTAGCSEGNPYVTANLTNYNGTNTISIKNDGVELTPGTFGDSYQHSFTLGSPFVPHVVVYAVKAHDDAGHPEFSPHGTLNVPACQTPPTTTVPATTTTVAPTTTTTTHTTTTTVVVTTTTPTTVAPTTTTITLGVPPTTTRPSFPSTTVPPVTVVVSTVVVTAPPTTVAPIAPAQTTTTVVEGTPPVPAGPVALPATGSPTGRVIIYALVFVLVGAIILVARRRRL